MGVGRLNPGPKNRFWHRIRNLLVGLSNTPKADFDARRLARGRPDSLPTAAAAGRSTMARTCVGSGSEGRVSEEDQG